MRISGLTGFRGISYNPIPGKEFRVTGVQQMINKLKSINVKYETGAERGLKRGGLFLQRESQRIVPVQIGNLKGSAFTRKFGSGFSTDVVVGYTANYAAYVHEDLTKAHGMEFNIKHAEEIARAGLFKTNISTRRSSWKAYGKAGTAAGGMFPRGEKQQAKFLETPARIYRLDILKIIKDEIVKG